MKVIGSFSRRASRCNRSFTLGGISPPPSPALGVDWHPLMVAEAVGGGSRRPQQRRAASACHPRAAMAAGRAQAPRTTRASPPAPAGIARRRRPTAAHPRRRDQSCSAGEGECRRPPSESGEQQEAHTSEGREHHAEEARRAEAEEHAERHRAFRSHRRSPCDRPSIPLPGSAVALLEDRVVAVSRQVPLWRPRIGRRRRRWASRGSSDAVTSCRWRYADSRCLPLRASMQLRTDGIRAPLDELPLNPLRESTARACAPCHGRKACSADACGPDQVGGAEPATRRRAGRAVRRPRREVVERSSDGVRANAVARPAARPVWRARRCPARSGSGSRRASLSSTPSPSGSASGR